MFDSNRQRTIGPEKRLMLALLVAVTFFMENLDATVIATAIPDMARDFSVTPVALNIGISSYLVAVAIFIPMSSWLVNRLGARCVFSSAILLFTLSSILCALSTTLWMFTLSRILQGIGGALMVPVGRMVVLSATEKKDMVKTIAFISWPGLIAPILGPVTGGAIVTYSSWQWIFWLNIPIGAIALIASLILVPGKVDVVKISFDFKGFIFTGLFCVLSIVGLELIGHMYVNVGMLSLAMGIAAGILALKHSRTISQPLVSLIPFHSKSFSATIVGGSFFRASINSIPFLLPMLFQLVFGWSAIEAGMMVLWVFAGNFAIKPFTTKIIFRWGFKRVLLLNGLISLLAMLSCLLLTPTLSYITIATILFAGGMTRSLQYSCYNSLGFADIQQEQMKDASVLFSVFLQFSMSAGVALSALIIRVSMYWHGNSISSSVDISTAFLGMSFLVVLSLGSVYRLPHNVGSKVISS